MEPPYLQRQVIDRVLSFQGETGRLGTAFVIDTEDVQFLITARHNTRNDPDETVRLRDSTGDLAFEQTLARVDPLEDTVDVAVFKLDVQLSRPDLQLEMDSSDLVLTQEVLIVGFPVGRDFVTMRQPNGDEMCFPMVKRGIVGAFDGFGEDSSLYLDLQANPGFSGGPVLYQNARTGSLTVAGVVVQEAKEGHLPAGISRACRDTYALKVIREYLAARR